MDARAFPKVDLHCHLELAFRHATMARLAHPTPLDDLLVRVPMGSLPDVLNRFLAVRDLLASEELLEELAFEAVEDAYTRSNVRILELRYAPSFLLEKHTHLQADRLHAAIERGVRRAEAAYPVAVGLICILQRTKSAVENASWTDFALEHRGSFLALDLADDEVAFGAGPFVPLFERARAAGLGITVHAGEPAVPGIARNVRHAVEEMGARRIGHGLQAVHDPEVVALLAETGTVLELCLTSNVLTGAAADFPSHPLRRLYEAGVRVTLNTDDPGIMDTDMNREYALAAAHHGFRAAELGRCAQWAAEASFLPEERKREVWPA